jgi:aryl-alcohol dehydrogenase-like predicted oxidoreductase
MFKKLALGTAQFGLNYGISNARGLIPKSEIFEILDHAKSSGIDTLDTAPVYGKAESLIGEYLEQNNSNDFKVISKIQNCKSQEIFNFAKVSLNSLNLNVISGILVHDYVASEYNTNWHQELIKLRDAGFVNKIGFSLNFTQELDSILDAGYNFDLIQVPFNLFDRRFLPYFQILNDQGVEIHVRSMFLQGLILMPVHKVPLKLKPVIPYKEKLESYVSSTNLSHEALALGFVLKNNYVAKAIMGVESLKTFEKNIQTVQSISSQSSLIDWDFSDLIIEDENLIVPSKWVI